MLKTDLKPIPKNPILFLFLPGLTEQIPQTSSSSNGLPLFIITTLSSLNIKIMDEEASSSAF